jgi:cysteine-rich repeat protein
MSMLMIRYFGLSCIFSVLVFTACTPDPVSSFMGPMLLANSPVHFGDSPQGVRSRGRLVITNGGDIPLEINDFKIEPDDGIFQVGFSELPLIIAGRRSKEITIQFWPRAVGAFKADISFDSNHDGDTLTPIVLLGNGVSDQTCLPCTPPPEPECHFDLESSLVYIPSTSTDCENESGECGYRIIEVPCENELCDTETGLCPNGVIPTFDAGPGPSICGDGELEDDEECDDGNTNNGDGCSEGCTEENGWDCTNEPCEPICGDGQVLGNEECDDGNTDNGDGCSDTCIIESGWDCSEEPCETICGDGQILEDEECDDGNTDNGDGCSDTCMIESGWDCSEEPCETICGDGEIAGNEECDDSNTILEWCDYAEESCTVCGPLCSYVPGITQNCGDGIVQANEECDDGASGDGEFVNSNTTPDACRENCMNPVCGDHTQDSSEECDDGNTSTEACDYGEESCTVCGETCTHVPGATSMCGDGIIQGIEECDDGTDSLTGNSNQRTDACRMTCIEYSCGDGWVDSGEVCDDGNNDPNDGCDTACLVEDDWECVGNPSVCTQPINAEGGETCIDATVINTSSGTLTGHYGDADDYAPADYSGQWSISCTDHYDASGPDAVYAIELENNANLHVEVGPQSNADISIYLLDSCTPVSNSCVAGSDAYVANQQGIIEIFDYTWPGTEAGNATQTFYLVIDAYCSIGSSYCPTSADTFELSWQVN